MRWRSKLTIRYKTNSGDVWDTFLSRNGRYLRSYHGSEQSLWGERDSGFVQPINEPLPRTKRGTTLSGVGFIGWLGSLRPVQRTRL
jgi:hypothetical protein